MSLALQHVHLKTKVIACGGFVPKTVIVGLVPRMTDSTRVPSTLDVICNHPDLKTTDPCAVAAPDVSTFAIVLSASFRWERERRVERVRARKN
jgi:hypothetical protein